MNHITPKQFAAEWHRAAVRGWNIEQLSQHIGLSVGAIRQRKYRYENENNLTFQPLKRPANPVRINDDDRKVLQRILNKGY